MIIGGLNIDFKNKKHIERFKSLLHTFELKHSITKPTHTTEISSVLIDNNYKLIIIANRPKNLTNLYVFTNSIADHDMIDQLFSWRTKIRRSENWLVIGVWHNWC